MIDEIRMIAIYPVEMEPTVEKYIRKHEAQLPNTYSESRATDSEKRRGRCWEKILGGMELKAMKKAQNFDTLRGATRTFAKKSRSGGFLYKV